LRYGDNSLDTTFGQLGSALGLSSTASLGVNCLVDFEIGTAASVTAVPEPGDWALLLAGWRRPRVLQSNDCGRGCACSPWSQADGDCSGRAA